MTAATSLMSRLGALSFSHLAGIGRGPKAGTKPKSEDKDKDEPKDKAEKGDDDKDYAKGEDKDDKDQDRSNGDSKAEDDKPGEEDDKDKDKDEPKDKKGKKGKANKADDSGESEDEEMEGEDDEEEMHGSSPAAAARRRERARCAAIFADRAAARNPQLAAQLAFNTSLTRSEALAVLNGTKAVGGDSGSSQRQERNPRLGPGGEASPSSSHATAASWDSAMQRVRPDLKKK